MSQAGVIAALERENAHLRTETAALTQRLRASEWRNAGLRGSGVGVGVGVGVGGRAETETALRWEWKMAEDDAWRDEVVQEHRARPRDVEPDAPFHGVYLTGLPPRLTLAALCSSICAGRIYRVFLSATATTGSDALVAFVAAAAARRFYRTVRTNGLCIAGREVRPSGVFSDHGARIAVSEWTQAEVARRGWTRCLRLANVPSALAAEVARCLGERGRKTVESVVWSERGRAVQINMAGVYLAQSFMAKLRQRSEFGCVDFTYAPDPCERSPPPPPPPPPPQPALSPYRSALLSIPNPNPSCRRLVFTELPYQPRLSTFAQHIRGGTIESIHLYTDRPPPHLRPVAAIVTFKHPAAAWCCYLYLTTTAAAKLPATLLPFSEVRVDRRPHAHAHVPPANARRSVRITPRPPSLAQDVAAAIATLQRSNYVGRPSQLLQGITTDPDDADAARVVFSQIRIACTVVAHLRGLPTYRRCVFSYVKDPWESAGVEDRRKGKVVRFALA